MESNVSPIKVALEIPQQICSKLYYDGCFKIDHHNRKQQDNLKLKKKLGTHDLSKRVDMSLFGMLVVDTYIMYIGCTQPNEKVTEPMNIFIHKLKNELID